MQVLEVSEDNAAVLMNCTENDETEGPFFHRSPTECREHRGQQNMKRLMRTVAVFAEIFSARWLASGDGLCGTVPSASMWCGLCTMMMINAIPYKVLHRTYCGRAFPAWNSEQVKDLVLLRPTLPLRGQPQQLPVSPLHAAASCTTINLQINNFAAST